MIISGEKSAELLTAILEVALSQLFILINYVFSKCLLGARCYVYWICFK